MSSEPLDVSLRVRMRYEAAGTARQVTGDLDQVRSKAQQLGAISTGDRLGRDLRGLSAYARTVQEGLAGLNALAARLGVESGTSRLEAGLKRLEAPAAEAARRIEATHRAAVRLGTGDPAARLASGLDAVSGSAQRTARAVDATAQAATRFGAVSGPRELTRELGAAARGADTARREMAGLTLAVDRLGQGRSVRFLERDLAEAGRAADGLQRRIDGLHRRRSAGPGMGIVRPERFAFANEALMASGFGGVARLSAGGAAAGGLAVGAGAAVAGGAIAGATRQAISFESAMAEVQKAVNDLTPEKFAEMERTILRSSRATGIQKEQMAALVAQAGFAGRPTEDLARFAEFGAKAAGAFGMTAEATGDALAKMGNVFKLPQAGIEDLADGINVLGDTTAAKERQIVDFLYRTGSTGQALRFTALQTAAVGAAVISTGKEAEVAATGFNALATKLGTADHQGKEFQQGLRALGLSGRRVKAEMTANPVEGFLNILERINKLPDAKKLDVTTKIGGMEYGDDLLSVAGSVDQIRAALGRLTNQVDRAGSVEKTFKIFDATTERGVARMTSNIEAFATRIGQRFTPAVRESAGVVERWFGGMVKAMEVSDRANALSTKQLKGEALTKPEQDELKANPRLRAETDRRVASGREDAERRSILEDGRRGGTRPPPPAATPRAPRPRQPDDLDAQAAEARERTRQRLDAEIKGLAAEIEVRRAGGFETTADRRRLRSLRQQYDRQFPAPIAREPERSVEPAIAPAPTLEPRPAPPSTPVPPPATARRLAPVPAPVAPIAREPERSAGPAAAPAPIPEPRPAPPSTPVPPPAAARQPAPPPAPVAPIAREPKQSGTPDAPPAAGIGKQSALADEARISLAGYHETVERSLARTERLVRDAGRRMREDLAIGAKVDLAALRTDPSQQIRIERAAFGGAAVTGRPGRGVAGASLGASSSGASSSPLATIAPRITAAMPRVAPGRFGIVLPGARPEDGEGAPGSGARQASRPAAPQGRLQHPEAAPSSDTNGGRAARYGAVGAPQGAPQPAGQDQTPAQAFPGVDVARLPAGMRNNNPGNIKFTGSRWQKANFPGLVGPSVNTDQGDPQAVFNSPQTGMNAMARLLRGKFSGGRVTANDLIAAPGGWTPGNYGAAANVARSMGVSPTDRLDLNQPEQMQRFMRGLITQEHGPSGKLYSDEMIARAARGGDEAARPGGQPGDRPAGTGPAGAPQPGENGQVDPLGGAARRYSSGFGMRDHPVLGGRRMHYGQDMAAPAGTPVNSMQAGRVSQISRSGDVTVTHADGSTKTYRHIAPAGIREGQNVEAGGPIGRLRAHDPRSTGPHLHLEATDAQGRRYDPRAEIDAARRQTGDVAGHHRAPAEAARPADDAGMRQLRPWTAQPPGEAAQPRPAQRNQDAEVERPQLERASLRLQDRSAPKPADLAPERHLPQADDPRAPSPRFAEPRQVEARRRPDADGPGHRSGGVGQVASAGPVTQNFHGGFDAGEVARRSTIERNRGIRRSQAGALHSIGRIA